MNKRIQRILSLLLILFLLVLVTYLSLAIGSREMSFSEANQSIKVIISTLKAGTRGGSNAEIVAILRLPRTLAGLVVGAALGVAGAMVQGHTRNILAGPGMLGVGVGANFAMVMGILYFGALSPLNKVLFAFIGSIITIIVVFSFGAAGKGASDPLTLILSGAIVSTLLGAISSAILIGNVLVASQLRFWSVGTLARPEFKELAIISPFLLVGIILGIATSPTLNLLIMGDDIATGLGVNVKRSRIFGMTVFSLLTAAATALTGPIGFVGLIVPHIARKVVNADYRWIIPLSALLGSTLLLIADILSRIIIRPQEIQVAIAMGLIGAPCFIYFVRHAKVVKI